MSLSLSTIPANPIIMSSNAFVDQLYGGGEKELFQNEKRVQSMLTNYDNLKYYSQLIFKTFTANTSLSVPNLSIVVITNSNPLLSPDVTVTINGAFQVVIGPTQEVTLLVTPGDVKAISGLTGTTLAGILVTPV